MRNAWVLEEQHGGRVFAKELLTDGSNADAVERALWPDGSAPRLRSVISVSWIPNVLRLI